MALKYPPELFLRSSSTTLSSLKGVTSSSGKIHEQRKLLKSNPVSSNFVNLHRRYYKAARCTELGKPMSIGVVESRKLNCGEVRVQVEAAGVNFGDLLMQEGTYQVKLPLPFTPGSEMSGIVLEVADDVDDLRPGMNVAGMVTTFGCFAEECVTTAQGLWRMPDKMTFKEGAAFVCTYGTAMLALKRRANVQPGETVLVTAAAGGAGLAAIDIASNVLGANAVGAAGSDEKCELVKKYGAKDAINYRTENVKERMMKFGGADVVFDTVGGSIFKDALRSIAFEGRLIVIGFASGEIPKIPANHLLVKNASAVGVYWGGYSFVKSDVFRWSVDECFKQYNEGKLKPHISASFELSQINNAFEFIKSRNSTGKVVVMMNR